MSLGELRAALDGVRGLTEDARGHAGLAGERLDEAVAILTDLTSRSGAALPAADFARVREEVDTLVQTLEQTAVLVDEFAARL